MNFRAANTTNFNSLYNSIGNGVNIFNFRKHENYSIIVSDTTAWPNGIYDIDVREHSIEDVVENIYKNTEEFRIKPLIISIDNEELDWSLRKSGHHYYPIEQWVGMYSAKSRIEIPPVDSSVFAEALRPDSDIPAWVKVVSGTLFKGKALAAEIFYYLLEKGHTLVALWKGDAIIGTALIYRDEDNISGLYLVSVKDEFRGRGFGKIIIKYCLEVIESRECKACVLQSTKAGIRLYESMGFAASNLYNLFWKLK